MRRQNSVKKGQPFGRHLGNIEQAIPLPALVGFGFIPYEGHFHRCAPSLFAASEIPCDSAYHEHGSEVLAGPASLFGHAFCKLFATGNLSRAVATLSAIDPCHHDFIDKVRLSDARAVVRLSDLLLHLDGDGELRGISGVADSMVGATPAGIGALLPHIPFRGPRFGHAGTIKFGGDWDHEQPCLDRDDDGHAFVEFGVRFRIGRLGDWVGRQLTGHSAPWAFVVIRVTVVRTTGFPSCIRFGIRTSRIPSSDGRASPYHPWYHPYFYPWYNPAIAAGSHCMLPLAGADIDAFIKANSSDAKIPPGTEVRAFSTLGDHV